MSETVQQDSRRAELHDAVRSLTSISSELLESYALLARKADRVENELQRRVGELEAILEALPTGVLVRDGEGRPIRVNSAALSILGCSQQDLLTGDVDELLRPLVEGRPLRRADGSQAYVVHASAAVRTRGDECVGRVEILDDQTERQVLTERLHRMDKMAALGTMAAGIAHEIRNPLNAVRGFAELLVRKSPDGVDSATLERFAGNIARGAAEVEEIVASMLTFADPEPLRLEELSIAELCAEAVRSATAHVDAAAWPITSALDDGTFRGDRIKLRQALRNLLANAIDAQPRGGKIELHAARAGGEVVFTVSDAGSGFDAATRARLVDPFFTTRASGTGLGLTLVDQIAELHGGRLHIHDRPSSLGGAAIAIHVPVEPDSRRSR